jgi:hypothetical protein
MTLPVVMATGVLPTWEFALHPCLQPVEMLLKPYSFEKLLGLVKNILTKAVSAQADLAPLRRARIEQTPLTEL